MPESPLPRRVHRRGRCRVADGQVDENAAQQMVNQLSQFLFYPPGQSAQQIDQQYAQLVQVYDQYLSQDKITGQAARQLRRALAQLGAAAGVP
jgi:hypothetical protein